MLRSPAPILALVLAAACAAPRGETGTPPGPQAVGHHLALSTRSPEAQRRFDQGLTLYWCFDREGARRAFAQAAELDPGCALIQWGLALAEGPCIGDPALDELRERAVHEALANALSLAYAATPLERALIAALDARHDWPPPPDRRPLDAAYARALGTLWRQHPQDSEIGSLYAEALLHELRGQPFSTDGTLRPGASEALAVLEALLVLAPDQPGPNHLAVHAWQGSPTPEFARASANRLRAAASGAARAIPASCACRPLL